MSGQKDRAGQGVVLFALLAMAVFLPTISYAQEVSNPTTGVGAAAINQTAGSNKIYSLPGQAIITREVVGNTIIEIGAVYTWLGTRTIEVTYPISGTVLSAGQNTNITWNSVGAGANVAISYKLFPTSLPVPLGNFPNNGSASWNVPDQETSQAKVRVEDAGDSALAGEGGPFVISDVPPGTVPLYIKRNVSAIQITWESTYSPIDLYALTGNGTGQYTVDAGWTKIADNLVWSSDGYSDASQVGTGDPEKYYKALQPDIVPTDPSPAPEFAGQSYLATAWGVGKVNYVFSQGWNAVATPFRNDSFGGATGLVGDNFGEGDTANLWDHLITGAPDFTLITRFSAAGGWDGQLTSLSAGQGTMFNVVSLGSGTRSISMIGRVGDADFSRTIKPQWGNIGNPFPIELLNGGFYPPNIVPPANLVVGDSISEWGIADFSRTIKYDGSAWSFVDGTPGALNLKPGVSYWFNHVSTAGDFNWNLSKP